MSSFQAAATTLESHQPCVRCSYDLHGLARSGNCPECGLPVERSLRGDLLQFSDDAYRSNLLRGVSFIMTGIIISLVITTLTVLVSLVAPGAGVQVIGSIAGVVGTAIGLYGYYLFSSPDPGQFDQNKGETPRRVIRIAIVVAAIGSMGQLGFAAASLMIPASTPNTPQYGVGAGLMGLAIIAYLLGLLAGVVQFFAAMMYTKWLAPRIPSAKVFKRAKLLMWLGPVLYIFGCGIGQLVALVLYYNMFSWIRNALVTIRDKGEFAEPSSVVS